MNKVVVKIQNEKGKWCTWHNVAVPVKYGKLLDEQLDYAQVSLMRIKKARFAPLTRAQLIIYDKYGDDETLDYFVADDDCYENPVGSGCYEHTLTLIEPTKWLECFPLETLTFTNPNGNNFEKTAVAPKGESNTQQLLPLFPSNYLTPTRIGTTYLLLHTRHSNFVTIDDVPVFMGNNFISCEIKITTDVGTTTYQADTVTNIADLGFIIQLGENLIEYTIRTSAAIEYTKFTILGVETHLPLVPWTVDGVIQRVLQCVEPLRKGQTPRFSFDKATLPEDKQALFDKIAPEFTFTRTTLREALQQIGGFIHAEPRLNLATMSIEWDFYGEEEIAQITTNKGVIPLKDYKYRTLQRKRNLDETANALDSYQDNLVNRLDWANGTTATPFDGGFQTLRMDTAWARGEQNDSWHIDTVENIDRIVKVEMLYNGEMREITPYVYDEKVYGNLSSYGKAYPSTKAYALYYRRGGKGIYGLFFKPSTIWSETGRDEYTIVNIYNRVFSADKNELDYEKMQFRVTYVPIYSTRVQQCKQTLQDFLPLPRTVNYTQSDNSVETQYFGENIKGAIARMGNAEKNVTMDFRSLYNIPKAGQLFDDEYYISEVSTAVSSDIFQVTLGLSKNFNRKSKYIGASSIKRLYEVSEEQVQERHTVLQDYIVIGGTISQSNNDGYFNNAYLQVLGKAFAYLNNSSPVVAVSAFGKTHTKIMQERVMLPVISSAFGNSISFTWRYKDNFSAGLKAQYEETEQEGKKVSGYFSVETEYTDYYGRLYYYDFTLLSEFLLSNNYDANDLPQFKGSAYSFGIAGTANENEVFDNSLVLRKDSRETLKFTYNINYVTADNSYILGTALTAKNPLVTDEKRVPHLYILKHKLNRFGDKLELAENDKNYKWFDLGEAKATVTVNGNTVSISGKKATVSGQAWAYGYPVGENLQDFEDENGNIVQVNLSGDAELIIGRNIDITAGDTVGAFMMQAVHDIYKYYEEMKKLN